MTTTLFDYVDRSYDFLAFQNVEAQGSTLLGLELFSTTTSGQICTGIQKLTQRWLLEFLTEQGSMPGLPDRGTEFMRLVRQGALRTYGNIWSQFVFSSYTAGVKLRNEETDDWDDDERFSSAQLLNLAVLPGYANLSIAINSLAGSTRKIILPIDTLPQNIIEA
jgi:hypothetical protein